MMGAKINDAKLETIRQEFLGGASLRELAARHGAGLRTLASYSKAGNWDAQRDQQRLATGLPAVVAAADQRCQAVAASWRERLERITDRCMSVAERAGDLLSRDNLDSADFRDLAALIKLMVEALNRLREMAPAAETPGTVLGMSREQAIEVLRRCGAVTLPEDRRRLLAEAEEGEGA